MRTPITALALSALLLPGGVLAQPAPGKPTRPGARPAPEAEDVHVRAETQGGEKGHYWFRGFVDLQAGDTRIQSDELDFYEVQRPDGAKGRRVVAVGNVVFLHDDERISGERLEMDMDTGRGTFTQAMGYVQPGVFIEARTIERLDPATYRVEDAKFTSCAQPNPRWGFSASSARIQVDDKIVGKNVVFKVKSVPAFYIPYFMYPIRDDQRSTGFLFPHFGHSSNKGFLLGSGFFWAMGRSLDQTFYADHYSTFGYGLGHELRYVLDAPSRGNFKTYALKPRAGGDWDYDLDWSAVQMLPGRAQASLQVRQYSDLQFQQQIQDSLNQASIRSRRSVASVQRNFGATTLQVLADSVDTYFGELTRVNRHLPLVRLNRVSQKIGRSPVVFGFEARGEGLVLGDEELVQSYSRFDASPQLSLSFGTTFLQLTPRVQARYTHYGRTLTDDGITGDPLDRRYFEGSLELRGPSFSRVFNNPGKWYTDKFKHVIEPEVTFTYRSRVDDFDLIPKFDLYDQYLGTNQVDYALVQRFLAKRPGPGGKPVAYEFLTWRLSQSYYVQINENQNEFDPNYSSSAFGPGNQPDHNSPILSRVRFRPTRGFNTNFDLEYDVNFKQLRTLSLSASLGSPRLTLQGGWSRARKLAVDPAKRVPLRNTLRGSGRLALVPGQLSLEGAADYDIIRKTVLNSRAKLRYEVQCCGFTAELLQYNYNQRTERQFRFSVELANIGSMGNFMGEQGQAPNVGAFK